MRRSLSTTLYVLKKAHSQCRFFPVFSAYWQLQQTAEEVLFWKSVSERKGIFHSHALIKFQIFREAFIFGYCWMSWDSFD